MAKNLASFSVRFFPFRGLTPEWPGVKGRWAIPERMIMIDVLLASLGLLWLMFFWQKCWKRVALDDCRDDLFRLREEARDRFLAEGLSLCGHEYKVLRNILNAHLDCAKITCMTDLLVFSKLKKATGASETLLRQSQQVNDAFNNFRLRQYINDVREKSSRRVLWYALDISPAFWILAMIFATVAVLPAICWALYLLFVGDAVSLRYANMRSTLEKKLLRRSWVLLIEQRALIGVNRLSADLVNFRR
jgi:hypothetical protein